MTKAINAFYSISTSPEFREVERLRAKARHDEAQALHHARQEGIQETTLKLVKNLIQEGLPTDQIARVSGLSHSEIDILRIN